MTLHYLHLDVFTNRRFAGNQLAVFLDPPRDLSAGTMQAIANEMAFSESTFVFPAEASGTDVRVRIFTPAEELPMAGHPTIGTAFALAHAGRIAAGCEGIVFGEGVGPIPLSLAWTDSSLRFAWMTQAQPAFGPRLADRRGMAAALGLGVDDLAPDELPIEEVSCGGPFAIVPVGSRAAVDRAVPDTSALARLFAQAGWRAHPVYLFSTERGADDAHTYSRMFAPLLGITEDAATGSACGPLGGYLVRHNLWPSGAGDTIRNLQGVKMGRPSWIHIAPVFEGKAVAAVRVGGEAVLVGEGTLETA